MEERRESIRNRFEQLCRQLLKSKVQCTMGAEYDSSVSLEHLLDSFIILFDECNNEFLMKDPLIAEFVDKFRTRARRLRNLCVNSSDFEVVKIISRGRFAEISVVKEKCAQNVYVMKKLRKTDILNSQDIYFDNERNIMLTASEHNESCKWIPQLFYSFHDLTHMYLVMEYCPGGNLRTMLEYYKKNVPEPMLRFYMAEMIQGIHSVHSIGFVHRDIKPDNILVDVSGHLKLIDFGSSARCAKNGQICSKLPLNIPSYIPDYTAPEIFKFHECPMKGYGVHCDWWSLGIVLYELITGAVPFTRNEVGKLHQSLYSKKLPAQKLSNVSPDLKNIVFGLLQPVEKRLTYQNIVKLNYFSDLDWNNLRERDPPFVPSLTSPDDTSYCTTCELQPSTPKTADIKLPRRFTGRNLPFLGFTYMGNLTTDVITDDSNNLAPKIIGARRKTENFRKKASEFFISDVQRHSVSGTRNSGVASDCSNDSYQSAASVRLEKEVNQLHLFYNEKALIIEEKLKNSFHDMYNCMTGEQHKLLQEKEQLEQKLKVEEEEFVLQVKELSNKNKELENEIIESRNRIEELTGLNDQLQKNHEEEISKLRKSEKLKKDAVIKMNLDMQKLKKELSETSEKLKETEMKLLNVSNQQAAKLAMARTTLRSRSVERNQYEQENITLKNQLAEAKKEMSKLKAELEKKNKMKLDFEVKMTAKDKNGERSFHAECKDDDNMVRAHKKLDSEELIHQIETTMREVLKENLTSQGTARNPNIEGMISAIQRKLSILGERQSPSTEKQVTSEPPMIAVLESQIERLETQLDKAKESAVLHREAATQAKNELVVIQKQLADMNIDLRIAQREAKTAEEEVKQLKKAKYTFYKELRDEKQDLETQLQEYQKKLKQSEEMISELERAIGDKDNEITAKETSLHDKSSMIQSLSEEVQLLKAKNEAFRQEKLKFESEMKKRTLEITAMKTKIEQLENDIKANKSDANELKQNENVWKTKYSEAESTIISLKDTCGKLDILADSLEEDNRKFREENAKLKEEIVHLKEDLRNARKMVNEEKSLKIFTENKLRSFEIELKKKEDELKTLEGDLNAKQEWIRSLEDKNQLLEEYLQSAKSSAEKCAKYTELVKNEIATLKKDRTELLTYQHRLKEENNALRNELQEAVDELNDLQQANGELQAVLAQVEAYHEIRHKTSDEILQQHSKLVDFLRTKFQDASKPKRTIAEKLFRSKGKENLNPMEMENLLLQERNKSKALTEQLYRAQIELKKLRGSENVSKCSSPKLNLDFESYPSGVGFSKNPQASASSLSDEMPMCVRLKHNIPHKFDTKKCKNRGCKCASCSQPITVGQMMSRCKECHVWTHVPCSLKMGPTCGLPKALLEQFSTVNKYQAQSSSMESNAKDDIEGSIKVLRTDEECVWKSLNVSGETDLSLNSSILDEGTE